ncbi:putative PEP-binding protein [Escherichia coli]
MPQKQPVPRLSRCAYYEEYASLFTTQLRSIRRASADGSLKIMIPMILLNGRDLMGEESWRKPTATA